MSGLEQGASPVDLPVEQGNEKNGLGWTVQIITLSTVLLGLFNSHAMVNWANQLPVNGYTAPLINITHRWHEQTGAWGLNDPVDRTKMAWQEIQSASWPSQHQSR